MSRQQKRYAQRQLAKVDPTVLREYEKQIFLKGIMAGLKATEDGLRSEFGFGDKRLQRLAEIIKNNIKEE